MTTSQVVGYLLMDGSCYPINDKAFAKRKKENLM